MAFVIPRPGTTPDPDEIIAWCRERDGQLQGAALRRDRRRAFRSTPAARCSSTSSASELSGGTVDDAMVLRQLLDIEAIKRLKARYFRLMDQKRWDEWALVFAEDAHLVVPEGDMDVRGRAGGRRRGERRARGRAHGAPRPHARDRDHGRRHRDAARGRCSTTSSSRPRADGERFGLQGYGHYTEEYVREGGEWRIASLHLRGCASIRSAEPAALRGVVRDLRRRRARVRLVEVPGADEDRRAEPRRGAGHLVLVLREEVVDGPPAVRRAQVRAVQRDAHTDTRVCTAVRRRGSSWGRRSRSRRCAHRRSRRRSTTPWHAGRLPRTRAR